jgi:SagB-type dehydrogenase family enzyme
MSDEDRGRLAAEEIAQRAILESLSPSRFPLVAGPLTSKPSALGRIICGRRSVRSFSGESIPLEFLSRILLDCAGGVKAFASTNTDHVRFLWRTIPQAGGICSVRVFVVLHKMVSFLSRGIYEFSALTNGFHLVTCTYSHDTFVHIMGTDESSELATAAATIILVADVGVKAFKYGERGHRYALIEIGCALQNALISMGDIGLVGFPYGGFDDAALAAMLKLDYPKEAAFVTLIIGRRR